MSNENRQNEERMEDFESFFEESLQQYHTGAEVKGTIVEIKGDFDGIFAYDSAKYLPLLYSHIRLWMRRRLRHLI